MHFKEISDKAIYLLYLTKRERDFSQLSFDKLGVVEEGSSHHFFTQNR